MKLSIIVPVYNMVEGNKLRYCLDSLINQTIADYEIIAVDDASTDNSYEILKEYESKYPWKFKAIQSFENKKQGGARNIGLELAKGKWVGFVDSDDWVAHDMYEKLIKKAEETGADVVGCDYSITDKQSMEIGKLAPNNTIEQTGELTSEKYKLLVMNPGSMVIKIYLRDVIEENMLRFPENSFYEDNAAAPNWMLCFSHFEKVEEPLYYYYQHGISTVHTVDMKHLEDRLSMAKRMIEEARRYGFYSKYRREYEFNFAKIYYINTLFSYMLNYKHPKTKFLKKLARGIKKEFPEFQNNSYYREAFDEEQRKMAALNIKNSVIFKIYFKSLYAYRKLAKKA